MRYMEPMNRGCPIYFQGEQRENRQNREAAQPIMHPEYQETKTPACYTPMRTPGMVYPENQAFNGILDPIRALRIGTAFEVLNKPMLGSQPQMNAPVTQAQALAFTAWDIRLYLDTHPQDTAALEHYHALCGDMTMPNYACTFVPCGDRRGAWGWVDEPWPWEYAFNAERRA